MDPSRMQLGPGEESQAPARALPAVRSEDWNNAETAQQRNNPPSVKFTWQTADTVITKTLKGQIWL